MATTGGDEQNMPFIKNLASSDKKIRDSALSTLRLFLSSASRPRTPLDNLKLWKGLFFSLWMCDRPVPQQNLCASLASLLDVLPDDGAAVIPWLEAFWATVAREWTSIDVLRLEKFLLLVRRVFGGALAWGKKKMSGKGKGVNAKGKGKGKGKGGKKRWDDGTARRRALLKLFAEWPLESSGDLAKMPVGLRLHVLDIWVDELEKAGFLGEEEPKEPEEEEEEEEGEEGEKGERSINEEDEEFLNQLRALVEIQLKSPSKPVRARAKDSLGDVRLPWNQGQQQGEESEGDDEDDWGGFRD